MFSYHRSDSVGTSETALDRPGSSGNASARAGSMVPCMRYAYSIESAKAYQYDDLDTS